MTETEKANTSITELEREAEYNFNLYQDAGKELHKQAEELDRAKQRIKELEAIIAEAGKGGNFKTRKD